MSDVVRLNADTPFLQGIPNSYVSPAWYRVLKTIQTGITNVSITPGNGFSGSVSNPTSNPAITISTSVTGILKGDGTSLLPAVQGTDYSKGTSALPTGIVKSITVTGELTIAAGADLPPMTALTGGAVPTPPNDQTKFLRGDGAWANVVRVPSYDSFTATAGQTVFALSYAYTVGVHALQVFVNGAHLASGDFIETSTTSFTLGVGVAIGDVVEAIVY